MTMVEIPKTNIWTMIINRTPSFSFPKSSSSLSSFSIPSLPPSTPLYPFSESMMEENIENAKSMIETWVPQGSSIKFVSLFEGNPKKAKGSLDCIKGLRQAMHFLVEENPCSNKLALAQSLMQISMNQLQKEFFHTLSTNRKYLDPELVYQRSVRSSLSSTNHSEDEGDFASEDEISRAGDSVSNVMLDLGLIADCMIQSGYGRECVNIYKSIRKSVVEEVLYYLGIEQYSSSQINKMSSDVYENMITNWLNAIVTAVKTLFHGERFLCDHVFAASETVREKCFTFICKEGALNLFKLPELITKRKRSPEKVFQLMDLFETISTLLPEIDLIFSYKSLLAVRSQILTSLHTIREGVLTMVTEFESSIQKNSTKITIEGGGIHPLTISVMTYLQFLANYSGSLTDIIADSPFPGELKFLISFFKSPKNDENPIPAVSIRLAWIILVLQCKLDSKAKLYKDAALSYLYLANNLQFILRKVRTTNLIYLLGEEWIASHERMVKKYVANYQAIAWSKVIVYIPENMDTSMSAETVKGCIKQFNSAFVEACLTQTSWVVTDRELRDEIRVLMVKLLVPRYMELHKMYLVRFCEEKNFEAVKLAPDDLSNYLSHLFNEGRTWA